MTTKSATTIEDAIGTILQDYAARAVFKGYSPGQRRNGKTVYRIRWHHDRAYECILDKSRETLRFPALLPNIPADSEMYAAFKTFVKSRQSKDLPPPPPHRRSQSQNHHLQPRRRNRPKPPRPRRRLRIRHPQTRQPNPRSLPHLSPRRPLPRLPRRNHGHRPRSVLTGVLEN